MNRKETIHKLLYEAALEILEFIKESEINYNDNWVPATEITNSLDLKFVAVPRSGTQHGKKDWVFTSLARMLEDNSLIEHTKIGSRAYYRSVKK